MSAHPLSLHRKLLIACVDVEDARFDYVGHDAIFFVRFHDGASNESKQVVQQMIEKWGFLRARMLAWKDGPALPSLFDGFTERQLQVLTASDGTRDGLAGVILTLCPWVRAVDSSSSLPGAVDFVVEPKGAEPSEALLDECRRIALAAITGPCNGVTVKTGTVEPQPADESLPSGWQLMINHASLEGVQDPVLRRAFEEDEDFFRDARERGFPVGGHLSSKQEAPGVFIPEDVPADVWQLVPLFSRIYVPAATLLRADSRLGAKGTDLMLGVESKRIIPVIDQRIGSYRSADLRLLLDAGHCVTPRRLTAKIASDLLAANPLWRIAGTEPSTVRKALAETKRVVENAAGGKLAQVVRGWADFTEDGAVNLYTALLNRGSDTALIYGHGALASWISASVYGANERPWRPALFGYSIALARALRAVCYSPGRPQDERLIAFIAALAAPMRAEALEDLRLTSKLSELLPSIDLMKPAGTSFAEWMSAADSPVVCDLRSAINDAFEGALGNRTEIEAAIEKLGEEIGRARKARHRVASVAERFELVGFVADAGAFALDAGFPFAGTVLALIIKKAAARALEALERNPAVRDAREALEATNAGVPPHVVRILRARNALLQRVDR